MIAIFGDMHANLPALEAVRANVDGRSLADTLFADDGQCAQGGGR